MENEKVKDGFGLTRILYIIEAALEYFVSIAVGTVYLAKPQACNRVTYDPSEAKAYDWQKKDTTQCDVIFCATRAKSRF